MSQCPSTATFNQTELAELYPSGLLSVQAYTGAVGQSGNRTGEGLLTPTMIESILKSSSISAMIPPATMKDESAYLEKQNTLLTQIKAEYCHYYARYKYALDQLFSAIRQGNTQNITSYLQHTKSLNIKLNDFGQIVIAITNQLLAASNALESEVSSLREQMQQEKARLEEQSRSLQSSEAAAKLEKQMIRYADEKQHYTNNLLKLYSVMNIVALGLLVYVYRASPSE